MKKTVLSLTLAALMAGAGMSANAAGLEGIIAKADAGDTASMVEAGSQLMSGGKTVEGLMYLEAVIRLGRPEEHVARAHNALGEHYLQLGSEISRKTGLEHFRNAAVLGYVPAQLRLGREYLIQSRSEQGKDKTTSLDRALVLLQHAATNGGDTEAAYLLGESFYKGIDFTRNTEIGEAWLRHAASQDHTTASLAVGLLDLAHNRPEGRRFLAKAAEAGSGEAMLALAEHYESGAVLRQDLGTARTWAARAAGAGVPGAADLVAKLAPPPPPAPTIAPAPVEHVATVAPVFVTAPASSEVASVSPAEVARMAELERNNKALMDQIEQLRKQMEQLASGASAPGSLNPSAAGPMPASYVQTRQPASAPAPALATTAAVATPVPVDTSLAAAPPESSTSASAMASAEEAPRRAARVKLTENERGMEAYKSGDAVQAVRHFTRAARAGDADAMNNLGMLLLQGQGVGIDRDRAMGLFRDAAEKGHVVAARNIGYMYQQGLGVRQDLARANVWIRHSTLLERRQVQRGNYARL